MLFCFSRGGGNAERDFESVSLCSRENEHDVRGYVDIFITG